MSEHEKAAAPKKITVSAGVIAGNKLGGMTPQYPAIAKMQRIQGAVAIHILFSATGAVMDATLASGNAELGNAAVSYTWQPVSSTQQEARLVLLGIGKRGKTYLRNIMLVNSISMVPHPAGPIFSGFNYCQSPLLFVTP